MSSMRSMHGPTGTQRQQYEIALEEYGEVIDTLKGVIESELPKFQEELENAGIPWTPGRPIPKLK